MILNLKELYGQLVSTRQLTTDAFEQARAVLNSNSEKLIAGRISDFCDHAAGHISLQSEGFYRVLKAHHRNNSSALKKIDFFENDLKELRVQLFVFVEKYFSDKSIRNVRALILSFNEISKNVLNRVDVENSQLLPLICL